MKLQSVHIKNFQSIRDSGSFETGGITCLVGKNEAGKTALLQALYRLNPVVESHGVYDVTDDYPRAYVEDYQNDVEVGRTPSATVVEATFSLEDSDIKKIVDVFGPNVLTETTLQLLKGYNNEVEVDYDADMKEGIKFFIEKSELPKTLSDSLLKKVPSGSAAELLMILDEAEKIDSVNALVALLKEIESSDSFGMFIYDRFLDETLPRFLYFDEYYQMTGRENIENLLERKKSGSLRKSDYPLLGLISLARLDFDELLNPSRTRTLKNKLEGAGNHLTRKIIKYWSQNKYLKLKFDVRPAQPGDPDEMKSGTNIWGDVEDTKHSVTTEMGSRSRGFVWFFSFLAWYDDLQRRDDKPLVLLLDEPGLTLHGKAQEDLLKYFEAEIKGKHQLIYTTHSPFMVDSGHFERVRIVQDKSIETENELPEDEQGTKVFTDVLEANRDTLFPLQGALGYEVHQSLFVGPNNLIVEGVSDLLFIQTVSGILNRAGRETLDDRWTITPVGGSDKVPTFVALIGAKTEIKLATLIDFQKKDNQMIENLYKRKLLEKAHVKTFADFTGTKEADIEDMFEDEFYLNLVNGEYSSSIDKTQLPTMGERLLPRIEKLIDKHPLPSGQKFSHYRPARYFSENIGDLEVGVSSNTLDRFERAFSELNKLL